MGTDRPGLARRMLGDRRFQLGAAAVILVMAAFAGGYFVGDDSNEVSDLKSELTSVEGNLESAETAQEVAVAESDEIGEELSGVEGQLSAERSLNGKSDTKQKVSQEYETDFPWQGAGTVGYLTIRPTSLEQSGEKWVLTTEAKNEGSEPEQPFCGDAGAVLIDAENNSYTGESIINGGGANCGDELQPGLTQTFLSEFTLPEDAKPVAAAIYGDYEQEEEAKTWELPH